MIEIDDDPGGPVEIWLATSPAGHWISLARGETRLAALIEAERLVRAELTKVQELLHQAKQGERR